MKYFTLFFLLLNIQAFAQYSSDSVFIRSIYDKVLTEGEAYENLRSLCKDVGHRLSGSPGAEKAVQWGYKLLKSYHFDTVYLQEIEVPQWQRGDIERAVLKTETEQVPLSVLALGGSVATKGLQSTGSISAPVIAVNSYKDLDSLGELVRGKIVLFKQIMDPRYIDTFKAYGSCATFRVRGASKAAKYGAVAVVIRSLTHAHDNHPHTGVMIYDENEPKIPGAALSTKSCDLLEQALESGQKVEMELEMNCKTLDPVKSYNVIAQINARVPNDYYITFGGHLDSWDVGEGAHDDGAGIVHSIEALRLIQGMGYRPKYNLRCVLFMNEENGNNGGKTYAKLAAENGEIHLAAIESDRGGFSPRGFSIDASSEQFKIIEQWKNIFESYQLHLLYRGGSGVDISPLRKTMKNKSILVGLVPDSQRYFDYHHAESDVFETVNKRELELGAAAMTSLIYLFDKYLQPEFQMEE
jgi:hypothetical protein